MNSNFRNLLLGAVLASLLPVALVAADTPPPVQEKAAPTSTVTAEAAPAPATAAPVTTEAPPAPAAAAPSEAASAPKPAEAEPALRPLDQASGAEKESATSSSDEKSNRRRTRRHSAQSERVAIGGSVSLARGEISDVVVAIGGDATSEGEVRDSVVAVAGNARVTGPVGDAVVAVFGDAYVDAKVGEVVCILGTLELGPNAEVQRDVVSVGGTLKRDPKAIVHGDIPAISLPLTFSVGKFQPFIAECLLKGRLLAFAPGVGWAWAIALSFVALYILIALLFGGATRYCVNTLETRPGGSVLASVLTLLLAPVLIVLLCITVVGIAVVPFLVIGLMLATLFGKVVMLAWLGRRITRFFGEGPLAHPAFAVLLGGLIVLLLYTVPIVGLVVYKLLGILGLGVVVYSVLLATKREKRTAPPPIHVAATTPSGFAAAATSATATSAAAAVDPAVPIVPPPVVSAIAMPRAGFWIRIGALLIDVVLVAMVVGVSHNLLPRVLHMEPPGFLLIMAIYGAMMWKTKGTTIGGIICGLRVVRTDGREIDWSTALVRALGCFLSLLVAGLGFIWVAIDDEKQSWHDKIAGTTVVHVRGGTSLV